MITSEALPPIATARSPVTSTPVFMRRAHCIAISFAGVAVNQALQCGFEFVWTRCHFTLKELLLLETRESNRYLCVSERVNAN